MKFKGIEQPAACKLFTTTKDIVDKKYFDLKKEFNIVRKLKHENIIKYICLIPVKQAELKN